MSLTAYFILLALLAGQRLFELRLAARNLSALLAQGAVERGASHYPYMVALHGSWFAACGVEAAWLGTAPAGALSLFAGAGLVLGQLLRIVTIRTLGERWTTRVLVVPGEPPVASGVFKYLRHPNYLGVRIELVAVPLIFGAWRSALIYFLLNEALLWVRVRVEERALEWAAKEVLYDEN